MTKENDSGWNGFVLEKDGKNHCIVLKAEGDDEVKEGHFRADFQGQIQDQWRSIPTGQYPRVSRRPWTWRGSYCGDLETRVRGHERMGG